MSKPIKYVTLGIVVLVGLLLLVSYSNSGKYFLKSTSSGLEIWKGNFAPAGASLITAIKGVQPPEIMKKSYSKDEVFPLACNLILKKVDDLLAVREIPDFRGLKEYLDQAGLFAQTPEAKNAIELRLNGINFWVQTYKADVAMSRGEQADLEAAAIYLEEAIPYAVFDYQKKMIEARKSEIEAALGAFAPETLPAGEAAAEGEEGLPVEEEVAPSEEETAAEEVPEAEGEAEVEKESEESVEQETPPAVAGEHGEAEHGAAEVEEKHGN
jgi:hypothetical protein